MNRNGRLLAIVCTLLLVLAIVLTSKDMARMSDPPHPNDAPSGIHETGSLRDEPARILINELMSQNRSSLPDEDGGYPDWIEMHNAGGSPISLSGYHLSDQSDKPLLWSFPDLTIGPGEYLIVFASGKDRRDPESGFLHTSFRLKQLGESLILSDRQGNVIDWVEPVALQADVSYGRDPENGSRWLYYVQPTPGDANQTPGFESLHLDKYASQDGIWIHEVLTSNQTILEDSEGDFPDWIELRNPLKMPISLKGYFLSNDPKVPLQWRLPDVTLQPEAFLVIFASGKDRTGMELHTNFKISREQAEITLRDDTGWIVDQVRIERQLPDVSYGRSAEGPDRWLHYRKPTPGHPNNTEGLDTLEMPPEVESLQITEVMSMNVRTLRDQQGDYPSWIEIFNPSPIPVSLKGFGLSDRLKQPHRWRFPDIEIQPGKHLLVFASGKDQSDPAKGPLHASFSIKSLGEPVVLSDSFGRMIDQADPGRLTEDVSLGRDPQSSQWRYYADPTPGNRNSQNGFHDYTDGPVFSRPGGFHQGPVQLELSSAHATAKIHYTIDGALPTERSPIYASPLQINKTTVVRARVYQPGYLPGPAVTHSYFINVNHVLPVVSVSLDPRDFDDPVYGIYSKGPNASSQFPYFGANFHKDIEVPASFQFYEPNGLLGFQMSVGFQIFGGWTRGYDQKSFAIYARNRYENDEMTYPFLENKGLLTFKHLVLRTSGQDVFRTKFRDVLATCLMQDTGLDYQGYRQSVLYINGKYWGIYNIREKVNRYFIHYNHGIKDLETIDILEGNSRVKAGEADHYRKMMDFITRSNLSRQENYDYIKTVMDVQSFMDYMIVQMYSANTDTGNVRMWRERTEGGKWRWMLYDLDLGFGIGALVTHDSVWFLTNPAGTGAGGMFDTRLIRGLMQSPEFRSDFIKRFAWHMHNTFDPARVIAIIDRLAANIEPEIARNVERWPRPASLEDWKREVNTLRDFARRRPPILLNHLSQNFNLTKEEVALFPDR